MSGIELNSITVRVAVKRATLSSHMLVLTMENEGTEVNMENK